MEEKHVKTLDHEISIREKQIKQLRTEVKKLKKVKSVLLGPSITPSTTRFSWRTTGMEIMRSLGEFRVGDFLRVAEDQQLPVTKSTIGSGIQNLTRDGKLERVSYGIYRVVEGEVK